MLKVFYREVPASKPVLFGKRRVSTDNVIAFPVREPTHFNGLRIVSRFNDGSIEVAGLHDNFIIAPNGATVRVS